MIRNSVVNGDDVEGGFNLFTVLDLANFAGGMVVQRSIVLNVTLPDFCWPLKKKAVYIDGMQTHRKAQVECHDEIND